jgi:hypothetical protein
MAARPELLAGFRADVGQLGVVAHSCSPAFSGTDMPAGGQGAELLVEKTVTEMTVVVRPAQR